MPPTTTTSTEAKYNIIVKQSDKLFKEIYLPPCVKAIKKKMSNILFYGRLLIYEVPFVSKSAFSSYILASGASLPNSLNDSRCHDIYCRTGGKWKAGNGKGNGKETETETGNASRPRARREGLVHAFCNRYNIYLVIHFMNLVLT